MVAPTSRCLTKVAARIARKFPAVRDLGARRLHIDRAMQTPVMELSMLPVGDASPGSRSSGAPTWARPGCAAPSAPGSTPAPAVLFKMAHAR